MLYYKTLTITAVLMVSFAKNANASLEPRLGGKAFYDTELNITWLAGANAGKGTVYDYDPLMAGSGYDGLMSGYGAFEWVSNLVIDGISG